MISLLLGKIKYYLASAAGLLITVFVIFKKGEKSGKKKIAAKVARKTEAVKDELNDTVKKVDEDIRKSDDGDNRDWLRNFAKDRNNNK